MSSRILAEACGMIRKVGLAVCITILLMTSSQVLSAQDFSGTLVFAEPDFPAVDSAVPTVQQLQTLLPGARVASAKELAALLKFPATRLFVLPYGSAFPEEAWPSVFE